MLSSVGFPQRVRYDALTVLVRAVLCTDQVSGFFSDLLFQPYHCATAGIKPEWISRNTVERRAGLSPEDFRRLYEEPNRPVVLTDAAKRYT